MSDKNETEPQEPSIPPMEIPPCPEDPKVPLLSGVGRLVRSSKALVALGASGVVGYLAAIGKVPAAEALEVIMWIVGLLLGATAVEDAAGKLGGRVRGTTPGRANWMMQMLAPLLGTIAETMMKRPPQPGAAPMGMAPGMPMDPMAVVPITAEHWNTLAAIAAAEGQPPDPYIAGLVNELLAEKLAEAVPEKPGNGKDKKDK